MFHFSIQGSDLQIEVLSLLSNLSNEPAQVGGCIEGKVGLVEGIVDKLLGLCSVRGKGHSCGSRDPHQIIQGVPACNSLQVWDVCLVEWEVQELHTVDT